jgi:hypothetical protein
MTVFLPARRFVWLPAVLAFFCFVSGLCVCLRCWPFLVLLVVCVCACGVGLSLFS